MVERFAFDQDCLSFKEKDKIKKSEKRKHIGTLLEIRLNKPYLRKEPF